MRRLHDFIQYLKIPLKNIWRNRRRSFITILGICVVTIALIMFASYINIMRIGLNDDAINHNYGHFQIAAKGYFDEEENSPTLFISRKDLEIVEDKLNDMPDVRYSNIRMHMIGLIGNFKKSTYFSGIAGMPDIESLMTPTIVKGNLLSEDDPNGIVIGKAMAEKLDVSVGESVVLYVSTESGSQEALVATIRGIYDALMKEQELAVIYMPIRLGWDLSLEKKAHRMLVFLKGEDKIPDATKELETFFIKNNLNLEIRTWDKLAVFVQQVMGMMQGVILVIGVIIFIIIVFSISNTMYMAINERTKEIGTMRALGNSRGDIIRLFLSEGFFIGLTGAAIGVIISVSIIPVLNEMNIALPATPGQDNPTPLAFAITASSIITIVLIDIICATAASFLPSLRAARIKVIDAIRER